MNWRRKTAALTLILAVVALTGYALAAVTDGDDGSPGNAAVSACPSAGNGASQASNCPSTATRPAGDAGQGRGAGASEGDPPQPAAAGEYDLNLPTAAN